MEEIESEKSHIEIPITIMKGKGEKVYVASIDFIGLKGCITQGKTIEEVKEKALDSMKAMLAFYMSEMKVASMYSKMLAENDAIFSQIKNYREHVLKMRHNETLSEDEKKKRLRKIMAGEEIEKPWLDKE